MEEHVYLGIKKFVVCIDRRTGAKIWRSKVKANQLITLVVEGPLVIAHAGWVLFGISRCDGKTLREKLPGLGYGHCVIASEGSSSTLQTQQAAVAISNDD